MKAFCLHGRPWFRCGVCDATRQNDEDERDMQRRDQDFMARMLAGMPLMPWLGCRIKE